jgi:hypothetical protein
VIALMQATIFNVPVDASGKAPRGSAGAPKA